MAMCKAGVSWYPGGVTFGVGEIPIPWCIITATSFYIWDTSYDTMIIYTHISPINPIMIPVTYPQCEKFLLFKEVSAAFRG